MSQLSLTALSFLFLLITSFSVLSQQRTPSNRLPPDFDSARMTVLLNLTKEMTLPEQQTYYRVLGSAALTPNEGKKLIKKWNKKSSFQRGRALLTHHNLIFTFYTGANLSLTAELSTLTRNIDVFTTNDKHFLGKISPKLGRFMLKLLIRYDFYEALNKRGDLEGIL